MRRTILVLTLAAALAPLLFGTDDAPPVTAAGAARLMTGASTYDGQPALCTMPDGGLFLAWIANTHPQGDALTGSILADGKWSEPETITPTRGQYLRPCVACAGGTLWAFWTESGDSLSRVLSSTRTEGKWSAPAPVSAPGVSAQNQEVVVDAHGAIRVVWQEFVNGQYDIRLRTFANGKWSEPESVTSDACDDWDPSVTADPSGAVYVAWSSFRDGDYDVFLKQVGESGLHEIRLSSRGEYDLHPWAAADEGGRVWVTWDSVVVPHHGESGRSTIAGSPHDDEDDPEEDHGKRQLDASIRLVCVDTRAAAILEIRGASEALRPPKGYRLAHTALPKLAAGADGTLWVAYRALGHLDTQQGGRRAGLLDQIKKVKGPYWWEVFVQSFRGGRWGSPAKQAESDGTLEEVAVAGGPTVTLAWQMEHRIEGGKALKGKFREAMAGEEEDDHHADYGRVMGSNGDIYLATIAAPTANIPSGPAQPPKTEVPSSPPKPAVAGEGGRNEGPAARNWLVARKAPKDGPVRPRLPRETAHYETEVNGTKYTLLFGDLHKHSNISRCSSGNEPSPDDHYKYSHDICQYDFVAMTDHSEHTSEYNWWRIQKLADLYNVPGSFSVLYGYEWSARFPIGHHNVIFPDRPAPILRSNIAGAKDLPELWDSLTKDGKRALTIPHTSADPRMGTRWDENDERYQRVCEIFQAARGSYECDGCPRQHVNATNKKGFYQVALAKGYPIGVICSSDHGWGTAYAVAYATENSRKAAFDALWDRRCYGSTTYGLVVDFRAAGHMMGEQFNATEPPELTVYARGTAPLRSIEIISGGKVVHSLGSMSAPIGEKEARLTWRPDALAAGTTYYYARIIQTDDEMAWTSPVWAKK